MVRGSSLVDSPLLLMEWAAASISNSATRKGSDWGSHPDLGSSVTAPGNRDLAPPSRDSILCG